jgi:hypothetical protein
MARSFRGTVTAKIEGTYANDSTTAVDQFAFVGTNTFTDGTAANKAQRWWISEGRTLGNGSAEDIDLFDLASTDIGAGAGLDSLGQGVSMTGIKAIMVTVAAGSSAGVIVGNKNATTAWEAAFNGTDTGAVNVGIGGIFLLTDPSASGILVADTTNHLLTITDDGSGSGSTYSIAFCGID